MSKSGPVSEELPGIDCQVQGILQLALTLGTETCAGGEGAILASYLCIYQCCQHLRVF
jgi:hypothetical protein